MRHITELLKEMCHDALLVGMEKLCMVYLFLHKLPISPLILPTFSLNLCYKLLMLIFFVILNLLERSYVTSEFE